MTEFSGKYPDKNLTFPGIEPETHSFNDNPVTTQPSGLSSNVKLSIFEM